MVLAGVFLNMDRENSENESDLFRHTRSHGTHHGSSEDSEEDSDVPSWAGHGRGRKLGPTLYATFTALKYLLTYCP